VITWSGNSYAAGFNVLFGGLAIGAACMLFGVREKSDTAEAMAAVRPNARNTRATA